MIVTRPAARTDQRQRCKSAQVAGVVGERQHSYRRKILEESFRSVGVSREKKPCFAGFFLPLRFLRLLDDRERFGLDAIGDSFALTGECNC